MDVVEYLKALQDSDEELESSSDKLCNFCLYEEQESGARPCCHCIHFIDGELTATEYKNKLLWSDFDEDRDE